MRAQPAIKGANMTDDANVIEGEAEVITDNVEQPVEESSPDSSPEQPQQPSKGELKRINTLTRKLRETERRLQQIEASKKTETAVENKPPELPPEPDDDLRYEDPDKYRELKAQHANAMIERAAWKAQQDWTEKQKRQEQEQKAQAEQQKQQELIDSYLDNALEAGLTEDKIIYNEEVLKGHGITPDLAVELYSDTQGPKLVDYLASNPSELEKIASMTPFKAGDYINRVIRPQALSSKSKTTNAPDPFEPTNSSSPISDEWSNVAKGYTFE